MSYKGIVLGVVRKEHVGRAYWQIWHHALIWGFGSVLPCDVGRFAILDEGIFYLENKEQMEARLNGN